MVCGAVEQYYNLNEEVFLLFTVKTVSQLDFYHNCCINELGLPFLFLVLH